MLRTAQIFCLVNRPSGPMAPWEAVTTTWRLFKEGEDYELEIVSRLGRRRKTRKAVIGPKRARKWIEAIENAEISMFPESSPSCDGSYFELHTGDMFASISLSWLNVPPKGAESLDDLADWLWAFVTPDLGFGDGNGPEVSP
jgi:hypothetical protein